MALLVQWKTLSTAYLILQVLVQKVSARILSRRGGPQILCGAYHHQPHMCWCSCVWEVSKPNFWSLCIWVSQVRLATSFCLQEIVLILLNFIPYRWLIGLQSSRDLEFSQPITCLLQRSLDAVFIGKCFAFTFRHCVNPCGVSSDNNLIASGIKPLGSINSSTNVITLLKRHFDQRKTFPSVDLHLVPLKGKSNTPSQSFALTCAKAHNTIHYSQRNSFLYESAHVSTSQVSHEVHFESYCDTSNESSLSTSFLNSPRAPSCVNNCSALLDATFKDAPQVKPALSVTHIAPSLRSTQVSVTVAEHSEEQELFTNDSEEATMTDSEAVEILHELISDWESSQITVDENSTASSEVKGALGRTDLDSLPHNPRATRDSQEDRSFCGQQPDGSLLCLSEAVVAELQSSFNRSANLTPFCTTKPRRSSSSVGSATDVPLASAMSYESPELFSSASSLASVTQRFGRSNPKQSQSNLLTGVSPELFGSSKSTFPATPSQVSSRSFCNDGRMPNHYITPTMHRQNMSRRNILCDISNKLVADDQISSQQAAVLGSSLSKTSGISPQAVVLGSESNTSPSNTSGISPQVKTHITMATPSGPLLSQGDQFSPDLFSPSWPFYWKTIIIMYCRHINKTEHFCINTFLKVYIEKKNIIMNK